MIVYVYVVFLEFVDGVWGQGFGDGKVYDEVLIQISSVLCQ